MAIINGFDEMTLEEMQEVDGGFVGSEIPHYVDPVRFVFEIVKKLINY